ADPSFQLSNVLICALNDLLVPEHDSYLPNERIVRGMCSRLFDFSSTLQLIPHLCATCAQPDSVRSINGELVPSIGLLYLVTTVCVPRLMSLETIPFSTSLQSSTEMELESSETDYLDGELVPQLSATITPKRGSVSGATAVQLICSMARLLMQGLRSPELPTVRPLRDPKPLRLLCDDETEGSSDEDEVSPVDSVNRIDQCSNKEASPYDILWQNQLAEIFAALRHIIPSLASSALIVLAPCSEMAADQNDLTLTPEQYDVIRALSHLHYALDQVYALSSAAMIGLNSIYSQHSVYIRSLWHLVQHTASTRTHNHGVPLGDASLFHMLTAGELPDDMTELQDYLPLLFAFADCLHHRLLCLTDAEICGSESSASTFGCGLQATELLHVGARLRDLMLGLIDISHPDQLPKRRAPTTDPSISQSSTDQLKSYREVLERVQQRADAAASGSALELRVQLHCWASLFRRIQRLVFQIYDWDRRCHRQSLIQSDMGALCLVNKPLNASSPPAHVTAHGSPPLGPFELTVDIPTFWFKESIASSIDSSLRSWLQRGGNRNTLTLSGAPFGFHSKLNSYHEQDDVNPFVLSNREVRQVLILKEMPFVIPFERRVRLFQLLVDSSRASIRTPSYFGLSATSMSEHTGQYPDVSVLVRRTHLYEDAFEKLSKENERSLQSRLRVRFLNQVGVEEVGVDGGGLSREFLSDIIRSGFDPTRGFFIYTTEKTLYPNPQAAAISEDYLKHYFFLGRILAKALYENMLVELQFAHFFLAKIASRSGGGVGFDYLHSLDPELYRQLRYLKTYNDDVRNLCLDFTLDQSTFGLSETVELKPGGRQIPVTNENRVEYMHLVAHHKLNKQIYPQVRAFMAGLNDVICIDWLRLFDADELQTLISGADTVIDIDDLRHHTVYTNGLLVHTCTPLILSVPSIRFRRQPPDSAEFHETLDHFWSVLKDLSEADKRLFLRFVTACSRPPMFGFRDLQPPFSIQITQEHERLPTASTCMNLLRLPDYRDAKLLRERLLYSLHANAGFEYC
ncbi:ubiquitin-protein ligase E3 C, partial [Paragonimus westermani]